MGNSLSDNENVVFSLDIGTRTVIGIVGRYEDEKLNIIASNILQHDKRAMHDGQIHDINSVVKISRKVKENLENDIGFTLNKVAIAAAGRALETSRGKTTLDVDFSREIDYETIKSTELEAVQKAQDTLKQKLNMEDKKYYCVGYTAVNYYLDDILIENLEGHKGEKITIEVIATFLPNTVVESLTTVVDRLDLEVINLTLEPIAALNVAVKKNLRLLNIALVDIGAGTSDIAITRDGTVSAYDMASVAGDEITEAILKSYLLDYDVAEKLKIELNEDKTHEFQDIVGISYNLSTDEILDKIDESIQYLASEISDKILKLNEKAPSVVFLIGGGSQTPRLNKYISEKLGIPQERVVIKDISLIENVSGADESIKGPDAITPIGIAVTAAQHSYRDFVEIMVNEEKVKLFNTKNARVTDALLLVNYNPRNLIAKRGKDLTYYINGIEQKTLGQVGDPAQIYVNDELTSLEHKLKSDDVLVIKEATTGEKGKSSIYDIIDISKKIYVNGKPINIILEIFLNDKKIEEDQQINDNDKIEVSEINTLYELFNYLDLDMNQYRCYKDDEEIYEDYKLNKGDMIISTKVESKKHNTEKTSIPTMKNSIKLIINGETKVIDYNKDSFQFIDIFNHVDFDLNKPKGNIVLEVNGEKAQYQQDLKDSDTIRIYWEN